MNKRVIQLHNAKTVDKATFEHWFEEHYDGMYRYCRTLIQDSDDAEDIVQAVFMDLWHDRHKLVYHTSIQAFLYKGVYFKCMNKIKHKKVVQKYIQSKSENDSHTDSDAMIYLELNEKIAIAVQSLPEQCRRIFAMNRFDGLRYNEIAKRLQLSPKTIENQMGKALRKMRVALSEYTYFFVFIILSHLL